MSETVTDSSTAEEADDAGDGAHAHPTDSEYIKIALILGAITGVEVLTYFLDFGDFLIPSLMFMMVVKFWLVATWFMHLRFDNPIFAKLFVGGLVLASAVYAIALSAFEFWA